MAGGQDDFSAAKGRITHGPLPNSLVKSTLVFIRRELPCWRDRPDRREESAEERLNAQLCKHLDAVARRSLPAVQFHHEEKHATGRRVDLSAGLVEGGFIGTTYHSIDEPFIVIEGKRLPTPGGKAREREYVTGGDERTGGIQRFKLGLHGPHLPVAAMVGYIQKGTPQQWQQRINGWISELAGSLPLDGQWSQTDELEITQHDKAACLMTLKSEHKRTATSGAAIELRHLWIEMTKRSLTTSDPRGM